MTAFDPTVSGVVPELPSVAVAANAVEACRGAGALAVLTEWGEFAMVSPALVREVMAGAAVVDARNLLNPHGWRAAGFTYQGVGF